MMELLLFLAGGYVAGAIVAILAWWLLSDEPWDLD